MRTCALLVILGLYPKMKNHPLGGWIFIYYIADKVTKELAIENVFLLNRKNAKNLEYV